MTSLDVAVVGAEPGGLAAALVLGRAARPIVLVEAGPGRNQPAAEVHGYLGHDGTSPAELRGLARSQLAAYPSVTLVDGRVLSIKGQDDGSFVVPLEDGSDYRVRRVVLASGVVDDLPAIEGLAPLWGRSVVHCPYCHGWELRDQPTAVLVQRPLDLLLALKVTHLTNDVSVCLNGGPALAADEQALVQRAGIAVRPERMARLEADGDQLRRIVFADGTSLERTALYLHPEVRQAAPFASISAASSWTMAASRSTISVTPAWPASTPLVTSPSGPPCRFPDSRSPSQAPRVSSLRSLSTRSCSSPTTPLPAATRAADPYGDSREHTSRPATTRRPARKGRPAGQRRLPPGATAAAVVALVVVQLAALWLLRRGDDDTAAPTPDDPGVAHVHGLGIDPADDTLYVATHHGTFRVPSQGEAQRVGDSFQDTMGFTVVADRQFDGRGAGLGAS